MTNLKARNKAVKTILAKEFGSANVSVKGGRGTATGWCSITIKTPDPCPDKQNISSCSVYCQEGGGWCRENGKPIQGGWGNTARQEKWTEIREKAESLLTNIKFDQFSIDDGYGTKDSRMSVEVDFI